ncbi:unnamed protein product [Tenebrio molitor]|nr:unnamed protein product [Tenebrio molitor]
MLVFLCIFAGSENNSSILKYLPFPVLPQKKIISTRHFSSFKWGPYFKHSF